jgi:formylglycine-generating enzyme required for sulfatase activity/tetratricopeptide (TPR) repeat protein
MNLETQDNPHLARGRELVEEFLRHSEADQDYRALACHAALPLVLTPELLKFLRHEFLPHLSWVAEVDLLLSRLCAEVAEDLYVMRRDARAYLIGQMRQDPSLGETRIEAVNRLLIDRLDYLTRNHPALLPREWKTQLLSAMLYVTDQRDRAARELSEGIYQCLAGAGAGMVANAPNLKTELARLTGLVREAADTLKEKEYEELVRLARLTGKVLSDRSGHYAQQLRSTGELAQTFRLPGIAVQLSGELLLKRISAPNDTQKTFLAELQEAGRKAEDETPSITPEPEQIQEPPDNLATLDDQNLFFQHRQIQRRLLIQVLYIFEIQQRINALAGESGPEWEGLNRELVAATRTRIRLGQMAERLAVEINERRLKPPVTLEALLIQTIMTEIEQLGDQRHAVVENVTQILNAQPEGDWEAQGRAICRLGAIFASLGDHHSALRYYEFARGKGDKPAPEIELEAIMGLAASYAALGDTANADRWLQDAGKLADPQGDQARPFQIKMAIGDIRFQMGEFAPALELYNQASAIARQLSDEAGAHAAMRKLAKAFVEMSKLPNAMEIFNRLPSFARYIGDHQSVSNMLGKLAAAFITPGGVNSAILLETALKFFDALKSPEIDSFVEFITGRRKIEPSAEESIRNLARKYEQIRADMPSGNERTRRMEQVMAEMKALAPSIHFMLPSLTESDSTGLRLAAVAILYEMPDLQYINWLADRFGTEKPFIEYHAADALLSAVLNLDTGFYDTIRDAINKAISALGANNEKTDRFWKLKEAQETLQQNWVSRYFNPPNEIRSIGRRLSAGDYAGLMSQLGKGEVLIGLFSNPVEASVAIHIQCKARMNEVERLYSHFEYFAVSRIAANEGMNIWIPPLPGEQEEKKSERQPFALSTFEFETVTLDALGNVNERRKLQARQFLEELAPGVTLSMVEIPGGEFLMGSPEHEAGRFHSEGPRRRVAISPFFIGKFAITQAQWRVVAGWSKIERELKPDPSHFPQGKRRTPEDDERPVEQVSWEDAREFCARLSLITGRSYRLPSEAEWECACRAGTTTPFAFGETITHEIVNYNSEYPYARAKKANPRGETVPGGSLGVANACGLFDMHGNVWEWCEDVWHSNYQGAPTDGSPWLGGGDSSYRVVRGGLWNSHGDVCRSAYRSLYRPGDRLHKFGFRVVVAGRTPSGAAQ